jgi:hypothetical protein
MAKSQKRSNREAKKPKTAGKKIVPAQSVFDDARQPPKKKPAASPAT